MSCRLSHIFFIILFIFSGCYGDGNMAGPCVHEFREPVLSITEVTDQQTGQPLQEVKITALKRDDFEYNLDPENNLFPLTMAENIEHQPPLLICTIPCGFENEHGIYTVTIEADGYQQKSIETEAAYQSGGGGCPSFSDDGTKLSFSLTPLNE